MSITIKELIEVCAEVGGVTKVAAEEQLVAVFDKIGASIKAGEEVTIRNFGRFYTKVRPAHDGRNPKTGEQIKIAEKVVIKFAPRGEMK